MSSEVEKPQIAVVMGSQSDWSVMKSCAEVLEHLDAPYHCQVLSAHRTPDLLFEFASEAEAKGFRVIIAAAGGAAHLAGMLASKTRLPVIGVPMKSSTLNGIDSLLSIVQMPFGVPVATVAIGEAGAKNAALLAVSMLALTNEKHAKSLDDFRQQQTLNVMNNLELEK